MVERIFNERIDQALSAAMNGLTARQRVAANNIANADTPGFKASAVRFEEGLRDALNHRSTMRMAATRPGHIDALGSEAIDNKPEVVPETNTSMRSDNNNVDIDREMVQLTETALTYNAVVQLASARLSLLRSIVTEGRQ